MKNSYNFALSWFYVINTAFCTIETIYVHNFLITYTSNLHQTLSVYMLRTHLVYTSRVAQYNIVPNIFLESSHHYAAKCALGCEKNISGDSHKHTHNKTMGRGLPFAVMTPHTLLLDIFKAVIDITQFARSQAVSYLVFGNVWESGLKLLFS